MAGAAVALALLVACRPEGPAPVTTSCGDSGSAVYAGFSDPRLPRFSARKRTEIGGGRLGGKDVPFGRIVSVAADPLRVYTLDAMNRTVFVHTLAGHFVTSFGREGEGPGELSQPVAVGFVDPDSVFVFDAGPGRLSVFSTRGRLLRTEVVPTENQFGQGYDVRFGAAGTIYRLGWEKYQASLLTALGSRTTGAVRGTNSLQRWSEAEHAWTGLADVPGLEVYAARSGAGSGSLRDVPYPARVLWSPTRDGLWYADNETYTLVRLSGDGERRCELRVNRPNPPVTETEREAFYDAADLAGDPRFQERLASIRQTRASIPVPATKPDMDALVVSQEGNLWVRVPSAGPQAAATRSAGATWQVFTPTGRPVGAGTLPAGLRPMVIRHDEVIGVLTDSLGVERLGMLSISWRG